MLLSLRRFLFSGLIDLMPGTSFAYRRFILRLMGVKVSSSAKVYSGIRIYGSGKVILKDNVWIGRNCHFYTAGTNGILIEENSEIGPETIFNCQTHKTGTSDHRAGECMLHPVKIGKGCWLGTRCTILCTEIGNGCVIGAASVVLKNIPDNTMAAGVPAKVKKQLPEN